MIHWATSNIEWFYFDYDAIFFEGLSLKQIIEKYAMCFNVSPLWILGMSDDKYMESALAPLRVPVFDSISTKEPIASQKNIIDYVWVTQNSHITFCLKVKGDSMSNARIVDGDYVFIRAQNEVEQGDIAVVAIDEDVRWLNAQGDKERLGYPTQKPEGLLERISSSSTIEGDTVLDAYCGCGTTVAVAQRLNRRWIGIDITYQSISLILKRLQDRYPDEWPAIEANIKLDGVPRDLESAIALANRKDDKTRKEFEKWAVLAFSNNQARINEKKGGDGGIDGVAYFLKDKDENGTAIFSVKSDKTVNPAYVDQLAGTIARENAEFGFLVCLNRPSDGVFKRALANGRYKNPLLNREDDRIQVITAEDILAGKRLDLPMARTDAVKKAAAKGDADKQQTLL
jgi:hypothetical protein